jgi:ribonuclease HI
MWQLYVDGAARSNPGLAGAGVFIVRDGAPFLKEGFFLGHKTNNQAEYLAFLLGVSHVKSAMQRSDRVHIFSDSLLLVQQLNGFYKVLNPDIKKLYAVAKELINGLCVTITHIPRDKNAQADEAANWGIDKKIPIPKNFSSIIPVL